MKVEIINIGTELLMGETLNTHAQFLSQSLLTIGLGVYYQTVVGDNPERINETLEIAIQRSNIIIMTGGIGPTDDDVTKEVFAKFVDEPLVLYSEQLERIKHSLQERNIQMSENNIKQAHTLPNAYSLLNRQGHANGLVYAYPYNNQIKYFVILPGPPSELRPMVTHSLIPYFKKIFEREEQRIVSRYYHIYNIGESKLANILKDLIEHQTDPTIAIYAHQRLVTIRVTSSGNNDEAIEQRLNHMELQLYQLIGEYIIGCGQDFSIEQWIVEMFRQYQLTMSFAESLTGGLVMSRLINVPGASSVIKGGFVTYQTQMKSQLLSIDPTIIEEHSVVSQQVANQMAHSALALTESNVAIAATGVAGPDGLEGHLPGEVYIALVDTERVTQTEHYHFTFENRNQVRDDTYQAVITMLYNYIREKQNVCSHLC